MVPAVPLLVFLLLRLYSAAAQVPARDAGGCQRSCGDVNVTYPYGIDGDVKGCYLPGFNLTCDSRGGRPRLLVGDGTMQVKDISVANSTLRVMDSAGAVNITSGGNGTWGLGGLGNAGPFVVSETRNEFVVTGCNVLATLVGNNGGANIIAGCFTSCSNNDTSIDPNGDTSAGMGYCQTTIPVGLPSYGMQLKWLDPQHELDTKVPVAVRVAERGWFDRASTFLLNASSKDSSLRVAVPLVLKWAVPSEPRLNNNVSSCHNVTGKYRSGYVCRCNEGYEGNPYLIDGCEDIDECKQPDMCSDSECWNTPGGYMCLRCQGGGNRRILNGCENTSLDATSKLSFGVSGAAGLLGLVYGFILAIRKQKERTEKKQRQQFFKKNRGHLLEQLVSQKADIAERMIISLEELKKATNNFDKAREIGGGGHGTVYKGILSDLHVVAIKKSRDVVQREIDEFINEVAILSQINHRNVVKLFGCCLETEVPLLAYEFISNGTLYHHLHVEEHVASLSWADRLRIATETARALAYLHSAVAFPIIHRDIKSQNILLDDTLVAKVSDFGASRCIPVDEATVVTAIQGTIGYMDPMYYVTGRLTEKSDVYSFGVLLVELLTRKKPYSYWSSENDSLLVHFTRLLAEGNLVRLLDPHVAKEAGKEVEEVAMLAVACVRMKGEDRPTMRQVEMVLEGLRAQCESIMLPKMDADSYMVVQSGGSNEKKEVSRQFSLEEEYLLSSRYPR